MTPRTTPFPTMQKARMSPLLTRYFALTFAMRFATLTGALMAIIALVTTVEMLDQVASKAHASFLIGLEMALLKLPDLAQEIMPFAILVAAMSTFWRVTRSNELVVARASGVSVWQFQSPIIAVALMVGILTTVALNPLGAVLLKRYDRMEAQYTSHQPSSVSVGQDGIWLRQTIGGHAVVIKAHRMSDGGTALREVTVFRYTGQDEFNSRIDAPKARLADGEWILQDARITRPGETAETVSAYRIKTSLTPEKIYNSFAPPETISFWELPGFIRLLQNAGFNAEPQKLQYHRLLSMPFLLAAMTLIAAVFSLRGPRRGHVALLVVSGVLAGFILHILSNLIFAIGLSSQLPVVLAAWTPAAVAMSLGLGALLYLEDG